MCRFRTPCIAALWTAALTLLLVGLVDQRPDVTDLAFFVALLAIIPSGWAILEYEANRSVEAVVDAVCEAIGHAEAEGKLTHLP